METRKRGKEDNINSELAQEKNIDINNRNACPLCNRPVKTGVECAICSFIKNVKEPQRKKYLKLVSAIS